METSQRATVGTALLVGVVLAVAVLGVAPGVAAQETNDTEASNVSFGAQVSAFMQSTAADANGSVDRGMWAQSAANATNPGDVVSDRAQRLQERVDRLERRSEALAAEANGSARTDLVYTARASAVRAELANLRAAIDQTAETATARGVDTARLDTLRERAGNVSGPAVAAAARNLTSGGQGPPDRVPGPATEPGPPTDRPGADPANGTAGGPGNQSDAGTGDGGPPDDRGNGGPPEDAGGGDGGAPDNAGDGGGPDAGGGDGGANAGNGNPPDGATDGAAGDSRDGSSDDPGNSGNSQGPSGGGNSDSNAGGSGGNSGGSNTGGSGGNSGGGSGGGQGNSGGSGTGGGPP